MREEVCMDEKRDEEDERGNGRKRNERVRKMRRREWNGGIEMK